MRRQLLENLFLVGRSAPAEPPGLLLAVMVSKHGTSDLRACPTMETTAQNAQRG